MVMKENVSMQDIAWVESHSLEFPELRVELQPQRFYPLGTTLAHVLGYVGEISPKQLEQDEYKAKGFRPGDIIGKGGLEQYYDEYLRGMPGYRKVLVDSRGRVQSELEVVPPQSGQDLVTSIDLDLQLEAEHRLEISATKRGTIVAMDPNNGEILVMASAPSFDPNIFVRGSSSPEGRSRSPPIGKMKKGRFTTVLFKAAIRRARRGRSRNLSPLFNRELSRSLIPTLPAAAASKSATSSPAAWAIMDRRLCHMRLRNRAMVTTTASA